MMSETRATRTFWRPWLALFLMILPRLASADIIFNHQAAESARAQENFEISAIVTGLAEGAKVYIYHRPANAGDYLWVATEVTGGLLDAFIPGEFVQAPGLEYYLAALDEAGEFYTHPEGAPVTRPFLVRVGDESPPSDTSTGAAPTVTIIAPDPGAVLVADDLVVVAALSDLDGDLDPSGVVLRVNGEDRTQEAIITPEVLTWLPSEGSPRGALQIEVTATDLAGHRAPPAAIAFHLAAGPRAADGSIITRFAPPTGRFVLDSRFTQLEGDGATSRQEPDQTLFGRLDAHGRLGLVSYRVKAYATSDESSESQPRNRLRVDLEAGFARARLGDVTPRFDPLTIWGKRMRGLELTLKANHFFVQVLGGATRRAIEGAGHDTLDATAPKGHRTVVDDVGTYTRNLRGLRAGIGPGAPLGLCLSVLRIKDDTGSITYGLKPKDNTVIGADMGLRLFDRRVLIDAAAALSWVTEDISGGALTPEEADSTYGIELPFDPEDFDHLLVLNASTTPLDPRGLSNVALHATARGNVRGNLFEMRMRRIGAVYRSLASTSLPQDHAGIRIKDSFGFLKRRIRVTGEYEMFHDNLSNDKLHTRETDIIGGIIAFTPLSGPLSGLRAGLRLYDQANGDTTQTAGVKNRTRVLTCGGSLRFPIGRLTQDVNVSYLLTERTDEISISGESEGANLVAELRTRLSQRPLSIGLLFGRATNRYPGVAAEDGDIGATADFTTWQVSADYRSKRVPLRAAWRRVCGAGAMPGARAERSALNLTAGYNFAMRLSLTGRFGYVQYDDLSADGQDYDETFFRMSLEQRF